MCYVAYSLWDYVIDYYTFQKKKKKHLKIIGRGRKERGSESGSNSA